MALRNKMLIDFYDISYSAMDAFLLAVCNDRDTADRNVKKSVCITPMCSGHEIFYKQWSNSTLSSKFQNKSSMTHLGYISGTPEMSQFLKDVFFKNTSEAFKELFKTIDFRTRQAEGVFASIFNGDEAELYSSLYNFTTVKTLFEIGEKIDKKGGDPVDITPFIVLKNYLYINARECYVLYKYLSHLSHKTYLQGGTADIASFTTSTASLFKKEIDSFVIDFGSELISVAFYKYLRNDSCAEAVSRLFPKKSASRI